MDEYETSAPPPARIAEALERSRADPAAGRLDGQACTFTVLNPDLQIVLTAALVTGQPGHGRASTGLTSGNRQAAVSYTPQPGYTGPDRFSVTLQPNDHAITVEVTVQPTPPPAS